MSNNTVDISKRTKGEWSNEGVGLCVRNKNGSIIAECDFSLRDPEEAEANAAFIVQACNNYDTLLKRLGRLCNAIEKQTNDSGNSSKFSMQVVEEHNRATQLLNQLNESK